MAEVKDVNRQIAYDVIKQLYLDDIITLGEYINLASAVMVSDPVIVMSKIYKSMAKKSEVEDQPKVIS